MRRGKSSNILPQTCSRELYEAVLASYPAAATSPPYRRLIFWLLLRPHVDDDEDDWICVYAETAAACEDQLQAYRNHEYGGTGRLLRSFKRDVMRGLVIRQPIWSEDGGGGKPYRVRLGRLDDKVRDALNGELEQRVGREGRVYIETGMQCGRELRAAVEAGEDELRESILEVLDRSAANAELIEYLNGQSRLWYRRTIAANIDAAVELALGLEYRNDESRRHQLGILYRLRHEASGKPIYMRSRGGATDRVFEVGQGLCALRREIRRTLLPDCSEHDLRTCHLAIVAGKLGVREAMEFLEAPGSPWERLVADLGFEQADAAQLKPLLKEQLNACIYGRCEATVTGDLPSKITEGLGWSRGRARGAARRFLKHPVIAAVIQAGTEARERMRAEGYVETCFGRRIEVPRESGDREARSALSCYMQAYELKLLMPAVRYIRGRSHCDIALFQHDGFSVRYETRDVRVRDGIIRRVTKLVDEEARREGIPTSLETAWKPW